MIVDREKIIWASNLVKLHLSEEEIDFFQKDLQKILTSIEEIHQVKNELVAPLINPLFDHVGFYHQGVSWREDEVRPSLSTEAALRNAPEQKDQQFKVNATSEE